MRYTLCTYVYFFLLDRYHATFSYARTIELYSDCMRLVDYVIYRDPWHKRGNDVINKECNEMDTIWKDEFQVNIMMDHLFGTTDSS
jgi:hypothetical protein